MPRRLLTNTLFPAISVMILLPCTVFSREPVPPERDIPHSLQVLVTVGDEAEPVSGADVFVKSYNEDTPFEQTLKTNKIGRVTFAKVPRGRILIQVTAAGCKTFGKRFDLEGQNQRISIALVKE